MKSVYAAQATIVALSLALMVVVATTITTQCSVTRVEKVADQVVVPDVVMVDSSNARGSAVPIYRSGGHTFFLTAAHVVRDRQDMTIRGAPVLATVIHPTLDVALISADVEVGALAVIAEKPVKYGDRMFAVGHHLGNWLLVTSGWAGKRLGTMSSPVIYGVSGGAALNNAGELVGIVSAVGVIRGSFDAIPLPHIGIYVPVVEFREWLTTARTVFR